MNTYLYVINPDIVSGSVLTYIAHMKKTHTKTAHKKKTQSCLLTQKMHSRKNAHIENAHI